MRIGKIVKKYIKSKNNTVLQFRNFIFMIFVLLVGISSLSYAYSSDKFEGNMMSNILPSTITEKKEFITQVHFINDTDANIEKRYKNATIKGDVSYECTGSVKAWLVEDTDYSDCFILYIGSVGKTYINSCANLFEKFINLRKISFGNLDTSLCTNMSYMFSECTNLPELDLTTLNTSNVKDMSWMFNACVNMLNLNVSNFDTAKVETMWYMFANCEMLTEIDVSSFDTSNVVDMKAMFLGCYDLISLDVSNFNTSKVTEMGEMFAYCETLRILRLNNFDTSSVLDMHGMFKRCSKIRYVKLESFNTSKVEEMYDMFRDCSSLIALDLTHFDTTKVTDMSYMFAGCGALAFLDISTFSLPSKVNGIFEWCWNLSNLEENVVAKMYYFYDIVEENVLYFNFDVLYLRKILDTPIYDCNGVEKTTSMNVVTGDYFMDGEQKKVISIYGDVDGDGDLTLADIMNIANVLYRGAEYDDPYMKAIDFDQDEENSIGDIMRIANALYREGY